MLNKETIDTIRAFAIANDWNMAFGGASTGNQHLSRMVRISLFLADHLNANSLLVEAGAWLHDFPLGSGMDDNHEHNHKVTSSVLDNFSLTENEKGLIAEAAASHEGTSDLVSIEAQVIHDADVLEKTGILGIIRHTWKTVHSPTFKKSSSDNELATLVLNHLIWRTNRLQHAISRDISGYLTDGIDMSPEHTIMLVSLIRPLAEQDMITEEIAKALQSSLTNTESKKLEEQLQLQYLEHFPKKDIA